MSGIKSCSNKIVVLKTAVKIDNIVGTDFKRPNAAAAGVPVTGSACTAPVAALTTSWRGFDAQIQVRFIMLRNNYVLDGPVTTNRDDSKHMGVDTQRLLA